MGRLEKHRQVTVYMDPELYEMSRCSAYTLGETIYEFVGEALKSAIDRRFTKKERDVVQTMARQNIKNGGPRRSRRSTI